jgi:hypothetical protein
MPGADKVVSNLKGWADRRRGATVALAQNWAGQLEGRAKQSRPWSDRTSNARTGLFGAVEVKGAQVLIQLGHSVQYGVYLELARDGQYAILKPTIDAAAPEIFEAYKRLWE